MCLLVETIRSENGKLNNIAFHNERMMRSCFELFGLKRIIDLNKIISVPEEALTGIFKCRIEYDREIRKTEFISYKLKKIRTLKPVEDNSIVYNYKYTDRQNIERLFAERGNCDDILIIKNGFITDTSYANVILRDKSGSWFTPSAYLLPGTRRASLLRQGFIREAHIRYSDLSSFSHIKIINAMIAMDDTDGIPVRNIL